MNGFIRVIIIAVAFLGFAVSAYSAGAPRHIHFKIHVVRAANAIDSKTRLLNIAAIRTEVTPSKTSNAVEVYTTLFALRDGKSAEIGSAYCHTGGPYGPKQPHNSSVYAYASCDTFPPSIFVPKHARLLARVRVSTAEGALVTRTTFVRVFPH